MQFECFSCRPKRRKQLFFESDSEFLIHVAMRIKETKNYTVSSKILLNGTEFFFQPAVQN